MENVLEKYKSFKAYNEAYEIVKTVEVVGYDREFYRIEVLKCFSNSKTPYIVDYYVKGYSDLALKDHKGNRIEDVLTTETWRRIDRPWVVGQTADDALKQALIFLADYARTPK